MGAAVGGSTIDSVEDLAALCRTICGTTWGNAVTLFAVIGACIVAAIVVMLCAAWVIEDVVALEQGAPLDGAVIGATQDIRPGSEETVMERVRARPAYFF